MRKIALFILIICVNSQLLSKYQIIGNPKPRLVNILAEVQTQLRTGGSLETQIAFLESLKSAIDEEQIRHDRLYTGQRNQCAVELDLRKKDIKDAEQVLNRANEQLENCNMSYNKARTELDNNLEAQKTTDSDVKILKSIRDEGGKLFENKRRDHLDALTSLQQVVGILDGFVTGESSLAQLGQAALSLISLSMKVKAIDRDFADISTLLAQVTTEQGGYREVYNHLKSMVVNFEQILQKNLSDYKEVEDLQVQEYDDRRVHLIEYFNNLKRTEQLLRDHITAMNLCQNQQTAIIDTARGKKVRNNQIFDSADKLCKDFLQEYDKASQVRKDQIDLIDQFKTTLVDRATIQPPPACPGEE